MQTLSLESGSEREERERHLQAVQSGDVESVCSVVNAVEARMKVIVLKSGRKQNLRLGQETVVALRPLFTMENPGPDTVVIYLDRACFTPKRQRPGGSLPVGGSPSSLFVHSALNFDLVAFVCVGHGVAILRVEREISNLET